MPVDMGSRLASLLESWAIFSAQRGETRALGHFHEQAPEGSRHIVHHLHRRRMFHVVFMV